MIDSLLNEACRSLKVRQIRPLTAGGQKQVHLVTTALKEPRVLKLIDLQSVNDPAALERARREVALLQSISHPNVVTVKSELTSIGDPIQAVFWLEDYLNGEDLRHCCPLENVKELQRMASDVASGLGALHDAKVVHRDLSPGNVWFSITRAPQSIFGCTYTSIRCIRLLCSSLLCRYRKVPHPFRWR